MKRTRVARIITRLNVGGPALQALLLTERLDPERYESLLICGTPGADEGDMARLRELGVDALYIPSLVREISPIRDLLSLVRLVVVLWRFRPDVVHTHLAKAGLLGRLAARIVGARVIVHTFHGNVLRGYFGSALSRLFLLLERGMAALSTRIISISPRQTAELVGLRVAARGKIVEIPLGLELGPFLDPPRGVLRRELALADDVPLVGIVARLVPIKGVDVFLHVARLVATSVPAARFVIVGDGELRESLRALTRSLGLEDRTEFLGWRRDLGPIYRDLDVVMLTSHNEGTPVTLIEALTARRPIVATAVGGVPDVVGADGGVLIPDGDVAAAAKAVSRLLAEPTVGAAMANAGHARVYPQFDASNLVASIDRLYTALVVERSDRPGSPRA